MTQAARSPHTVRIPLAQPNIGPLEQELVGQVLRGDALALGPFSVEF